MPDETTAALEETGAIQLWRIHPANIPTLSQEFLHTAVHVMRHPAAYLRSI